MDIFPDSATLLAYSLACFVLFVTPGPDMSLFLAKTLTGGRNAGFASMAGAVTGSLFHTIFAAVGLSALLAASAVGFTTLKIIGALYLLWLAVDAIRNGSTFNVSRKPAPRPAQGSPAAETAMLSDEQPLLPSAGPIAPGKSAAPPPASANLWRIFMQGIGVNLANPKVVLFFVTFLPQFVQATDPHASQKLLFLGVYFVLISAPLAVIMILSAERLIDFLKSRPRVLRAMDYLFASVFGIFAVKILLTQSK